VWHATDIGAVQVLAMTVYTAVRYRSDMSVFDHHTDGVVRSGTIVSRRIPSPLLGPRKTFTASQVIIIF